MGKLVLLSVLLLSSYLHSQIKIESGMIGLTKVKYIESSNVSINDDRVVFDTKLKKQKNRTHTVYIVKKKETSADYTYYSLKYDGVGLDDYKANMYLYRDRIMLVMYDLISNQSVSYVYYI